ncbi:MAG: orotidine-5'-phosphate decarboxylase [Planctomyces sp.]|nr:orotidine-5'-phosphate decarboxylase [Planctomyces sp.]
MASFSARLDHAIRSKKTPALVGLDPRWDQLPSKIKASAREMYDDPAAAMAAAFEEFCVRLIDVVAPLVPAIKPQAAFFEELGPDGSVALARVIRYGRSQGLMVICDAKRGDIGTTAEAYARAYLAGEDPHAAPYGADALTVSPYLGDDTLAPFVKLCDERGAGIYVLVRTSNPGSGSFQNHTDATGLKLYEGVADVVEKLSIHSENSTSYGSIGAVVGATYPRELGELRQRMPHVPLLIPGYGAQGGNAGDVAAAFDAEGLGAIVNSSRGINFAFRSPAYAETFGEKQWEAAAEAATKAMIADLAANTPAGRLQD